MGLDICVYPEWSLVIPEEEVTDAIRDDPGGDDVVGALSTAAAAPLVPRRVYSFLWVAPALRRRLRPGDPGYFDSWDYVGDLTTELLRGY